MCFVCQVITYLPILLHGTRSFFYIDTQRPTPVYRAWDIAPSISFTVLIRRLEQTRIWWSSPQPSPTLCTPPPPWPRGTCSNRLEEPKPDARQVQHCEPPPRKTQKAQRRANNKLTHSHPANTPSDPPSQNPPWTSLGPPPSCPKTRPPCTLHPALP